ncbi:MAG TPA: hypothetical protein VGM52_15740 [Herbaspirillum sp.]|jgi:hypothetical protein
MSKRRAVFAYLRKTYADLSGAGNAALLLKIGYLHHPIDAKSLKRL